MTDYLYSEPDSDPTSSESAQARIKHWIGDTTEFQTKLGLHDPGFDQEPYHPRFSRTHTENGKFDAMIAADMARYPSKYIAPPAPVPTLGHSWAETLVRTRAALSLVKDPAFLKRIARDQAKKLFAKLNASINKGQKKILTKLGEPELKKRAMAYSPKSWTPTPPVPPTPTEEALFDAETYRRIQAKIAEEKTDQGRNKAKKIRKDDPRNDNTIYDS